MVDDEQNSTLALATELTIAWLANPNTRVSTQDVPVFLQAVHDAVTGLRTNPPAGAEASAEEHEPAVSVRKSLADRNQIISMIDGKAYRSLTRHLNKHGLTPAEYRTRYGLKSDYPMVAPGYSEARRETAKRIGLGRKPGQSIKKAVKSTAVKTRKSGAAALQAAREALGSGE